MLSKTKGIIIRSLKYSESSMILDVFTKDFGKKSYIISGVRSKKSKTKAGILQVMNQVEILAYHKDGNSLNRIKEIKPLFLYYSIPFEISKSSVGLFMTEVCQKTIKETEKNDSLYDFLTSSFMYLDATKEAIHSLHAVFMIRLSYLLGFGPINNYSLETPFFNTSEGSFLTIGEGKSYSLNEYNSKTFSQYLSTPLDQSHHLKLRKEERMTILSFLIRYYQEHMEGFDQMKSYEVLKELMR